MHAKEGIGAVRYAKARDARSYRDGEGLVDGGSAPPPDRPSNDNRQEDHA